ncbi:hypothetical protein ACWDTT_27175, partial [Streptosporangium sandarakinum]
HHIPQYVISNRVSVVQRCAHPNGPPPPPPAAAAGAPPRPPHAFDWEPLEFDEETGWARLPDHHPMSGRSGLTMDGFEALPAISDEDYEDDVR